MTFLSYKTTSLTPVQANLWDGGFETLELDPEWPWEAGRTTSYMRGRWGREQGLWIQIRSERSGGELQDRPKLYTSFTWAHWLVVSYSISPLKFLLPAHPGGRSSVAPVFLSFDLQRNTFSFKSSCHSIDFCNIPAVSPNSVIVLCMCFLLFLQNWPSFLVLNSDWDVSILL